MHSFAMRSPVQTNSQGVRVTTADTGHKTNAETRKRIFDLFFTTKGAEGSGLDLWITANIVNKHQGSIHVRRRTCPSASELRSPWYSTIPEQKAKRLVLLKTRLKYPYEYFALRRYRRKARG